MFDDLTFLTLVNIFLFFPPDGVNYNKRLTLNCGSNTVLDT